MDGQDKQDYLAGGFTPLSSTIADASTRIAKPAPKLTVQIECAPDCRLGELPMPCRLVLFILSILCIHVQ